MLSRAPRRLSGTDQELGARAIHYLDPLPGSSASSAMRATIRWRSRFDETASISFVAEAAADRSISDIVNEKRTAGATRPVLGLDTTAECGG
ncbi:MAG: hypothetical protein M3O15_00605 [Acidobacteriota bacterium]|nr:hypothetical protein [Acidobacteriota bacterium]